MLSIFWLTAFLAFLAIEAVTVSLTSIWFAGGALAALAAGILGAQIRLQLVVFVAVSFVLLMLVRPLTRRFLRPEKTRTNVDGFKGRTVLVKERIDNLADTGTVALGAETWMARSEEDRKTYEPGAAVEIVQIRGARLIVRGEEKK